MTLEETQEYLELPENNPYIIPDVEQTDVPEAFVINGSVYDVTYKDKYKITYSRNQGSYQTKRYNHSDIAEKTVYLEMNNMSTAVSSAAKNSAFGEYNDMLIKPGVKNLENASDTFSKGMDQVAQQVNLMSDEVCGALGGLSQLGTQSDVLKAINVMKCLLNKASAIAKVIGDVSAAQNVFSKVQSMAKQNPLDADKVIGALSGDVTDLASAQKLCSLMFGILDNFIGDTKSFLLGILTAPGDLLSTASQFFDKMVNGVSNEIKDCLNRASGMVQLGDVINAVVEQDPDALLEIKNRDNSSISNMLPDDLTVEQLIAMSPEELGAVADKLNPIDDIVDGDFSTSAAVTGTTGSSTTDAETVVDSALNTDTSTTTDNTTDTTVDTTQTSVLADLANKLKK